MKKRGFNGIIALLSSNVGFKDWCTKFHMRVMLKKVFVRETFFNAVKIISSDL